MKNHIAAIVVLVACLGIPEAFGQQALIPFQGHLTQPAAGSPGEYEPVPNGQYDILFALYTSPAGGEGLVWGPERHENLVVVNGLVNALLGSIDGFESELQDNPNFFGRALYVGITVDADGNPNTVDLELVPRQVLLPAIQSSNADKLDGKDWRDFFDGTNDSGVFTPGVTKARDSALFDGIGAGAVFVDPNNKSNPKVKTAAVADSLSGGLNLQGDVVVNGNLTVNGDLLGIIQNVGGETGFLRIGQIQVCWGSYISDLTDDGGFEWTSIVNPTTLPSPFIDSDYIVVTTPFSAPPSQPLTLPKRFSTMVYERTPTQFRALTYSEQNPSAQALNYVNDPGFYIAIGRWR